LLLLVPDACLTSARLLTLRVPVSLLPVMLLLLRSILVFLPVIAVYCIPVALFLLLRTVVVMAACMMVVAVPSASSEVCFPLLPAVFLPYSVLFPSKL
jgi:hypothetical protein